MMTLQNTILEMIARGEGLHATMAALCKAIEDRRPDILCSVVAVDRAGLLTPVAGPRIPPELCAAIAGRPIGPLVGSCGAAAYFNEPVEVTDIAADPRWEIVRDIAVRHDLVACWSSPINDGAGRVLGAFAFYFPEKRGPSAVERRLVATCLDLCTIAFERDERVREREHRATHDELTGLGNRAAFMVGLSRLTCAVPGAWGLLAIDLDNLKSVNDTFGHQGGDDLLRLAADRIASAVAPDLTFRIGGDEFVVLLQSPHLLADMDAAAESIFRALSEPGDCGGFLVTPAASIGGAVVAIEDELPETVRQNADHALYFAKETGRGRFVRYWPGIGSPITERIRMVRRLESALREDRIEPWYQPIVELDTGRPVGLEALCRLRTADGQIVSGIDLAISDAQVAAELTQRMLQAVALDFAHWRAAGLALPTLTVNVCAADLYAASFRHDLEHLFGADLGLDRLILDINEGLHSSLREPAVAEAVAWLRKRGVRIALDDFGKGMGALTDLLAVPVDVIKLDPGLMGSLAPDAPATAVVGGLIAMAHRLGIDVVAESIETQQQASQLRRFGCRYGQGYYFAAPMSRADVAGFLAADHQAPLQVGQIG